MYIYIYTYIYIYILWRLRRWPGARRTPLPGRANPGAGPRLVIAIVIVTAILLSILSLLVVVIEVIVVTLIVVVVVVVVIVRARVIVMGLRQRMGGREDGERRQLGGQARGPVGIHYRGVQWMGVVF